MFPTPPPTPAVTPVQQFQPFMVSSTTPPTPDAPILIGIFDEDEAHYDWIIQPRSILPQLLAVLNEQE